MEFYDYVKKQLDDLGVVYSVETERIREEIRTTLDTAFADFTQADAFYKDYLHRLETQYKPKIDKQLALLSLPASELSEQVLKDVVESVKVENEEVIVDEVQI